MVNNLKAKVRTDKAFIFNYVLNKTMHVVLYMYMGLNIGHFLNPMSNRYKAKYPVCRLKYI